MNDRSQTTSETTVLDAPAAEDEQPIADEQLLEDLTEEDLLEEDLLVEEISIDGMCGVY